MLLLKAGMPVQDGAYCMAFLNPEEMEPRISNIWKAWISTTIGLFIPVITGIASQIMDGAIDWKSVKLSLIGTAILALTDLLREVKKRMDAKQDIHPDKDK